MARKSSPLLQVGILILSMTIANGLSVEERLQQLSDQMIEVRQVLKTELEIKDARLEVLEQKVARLELALQNEKEMNSKSILKYVNAIEAQSNGKSSGISRTCREARLADPTLPSGMHWIDPDGQGVGDDPIYVYCDMTAGLTSIPHNSEGPINVGHCADPGCYSRAINYNATSRQMSALTELSAECHQSLIYDCFYAPLELNGVTYSWWNDRDGNAQYFWAGSNSSVHTCQCGIDGNCIDPAVNCNCDAAAPLQTADNGVITIKEILPISRLNFGRTQLETSSGVYTLGRFECTGQVPVTGMPKSCEDLWRIGHSLSGLYFVMEGQLVKNVYCDFTKLSSEAGFQSLIGYAEVKPKPTYFGIPSSCANLKAAGHTSSGLYSVMGSTKLESVYCDFNKLPSDTGFQTWIGYEDVKSAPVYFYVTRNSKFATIETPIPFDSAWVNVGNAMNLPSGKFTAPRPGIYFFSFTGQTALPIASGAGLGISLRLNGGQVGAAENEESNTYANQNNQVTLQLTLNLKKNDQVWMQINWMSSGASLFDGSNHFTGFMLEEEIVSP